MRSCCDQSPKHRTEVVQISPPIIWVSELSSPSSAARDAWRMSPPRVLWRPQLPRGQQLTRGYIIRWHGVKTRGTFSDTWKSWGAETWDDTCVAAVTRTRDTWGCLGPAASRAWAPCCRPTAPAASGSRWPTSSTSRTSMVSGGHLAIWMCQLKLGESCLTVWWAFNALCIKFSSMCWTCVAATQMGGEYLP